MKYEVYYQTYNCKRGEMLEYTDMLEGDVANCTSGIYFAVSALLGNHLLQLQKQRQNGEIDFWYAELRAIDDEGWKHRLAQIDSLDLDI